MGLISWIRVKLLRPYVSENGYVKVYSPKNYHTDRNGYVYEHRQVAEYKMGRLLLPNEVVHHVDGNKRNNSPNNLRVMDRSEHSKLHSKGRHK